MKPIIVKIIIGAVGFGGGFAAGFFCHKKMNDVKFEEISAEEMAELEKKTAEEQHKNYVVPVTDEMTAQNVPKPSYETAEKASDLPEGEDEIQKALQGKKSYMQADAEQKMYYEKLWAATKAYSSEENANNLPVEPVPEEEASDDIPSEEEMDSDFLEEIREEAESADRGFFDPPHQIDLAAFYNERPDYDKVTIDWFEPDNKWIDDNREEIEDISSYVGADMKGLFSNPGFDDDPDVRFIRNDKYQSDYEIVRHHRSYLERE